MNIPLEQQFEIVKFSQEVQNMTEKEAKKLLILYHNQLIALQNKNKTEWMSSNIF